MIRFKFKQQNAAEWESVYWFVTLLIDAKTLVKYMCTMSLVLFERRLENNIEVINHVFDLQPVERQGKILPLDYVKKKKMVV